MILLFFLLLFFFADFHETNERDISRIIQRSDEKGASPNFGINGEFGSDVNPGAIMTSIMIEMNNDQSLFLIGGRNNNKKDSEVSVLEQYTNAIWEFSTSLKQWKYLKGGVGEAPNYTDQGQYSNTSIPGSFGYGSYAKINEEEVYIFGGYGIIDSQDTVASFNSLWKFNASSKTFCYLQGGSGPANYGTTGVYSDNTIPTPVYNQVLVPVNDKKEFFMYGGIMNDDYTSASNSIWYYEIGTNRWKFSKGIIITNKRTYPTINSVDKYEKENDIGHCYNPIAWNIGNNEILIFCGCIYTEESSAFSHSIDINHLWQYNMSSQLFKFKSGEQNYSLNMDPIRPNIGTETFYSSETMMGGKRYPITGYLEDTNEVVFFGGIGTDRLGINGDLNDIFKYSVDKGQWQFFCCWEVTVYRISDYETNTIGGRGKSPGSIVHYSDTNRTSLIIYGGQGYVPQLMDWGILNSMWEIYLDSRCHGIFWNDDTVCSSHGQCENHQCVCEENFYGDECQYVGCYGIPVNDSRVCSGNGMCKAPNQCECLPGNYLNEDCSIDYETKQFYETLWIYITFPVIIVVFVGVVLVIIVVSLVFCIYFNKKLKKFGQIEDIEIILEEQKLSKNGETPTLKINKELFKIDDSELQIEKKIGQGGSNASVFKAKWNGNYVAFKVFQIVEYLENDEIFKEFEKEVEILSSIHFPYILNFYGASLSKRRMGFIMEFCSNGDLSDYLKKNKGKIDISTKIKLLKEISSSMQFLHSKGIIHRDLKLENVLVTENGETRLMDFGLSKLSLNNSKTQTKRIGTSLYMAPEVLTGKYDQSCDAFSMGMLIYIVLSENFQPYGKSSMGIEFQVSEGLKPNFSSGYFEGVPSELVELIQNLLDLEPSKRKTFEEITDFFSSLIKNK